MRQLREAILSGAFEAVAATLRQRIDGDAD